MHREKWRLFSHSHPLTGHCQKEQGIRNYTQISKVRNGSSVFKKLFIYLYVYPAQIYTVYTRHLEFVEYTTRFLYICHPEYEA